MVRKTTIIQSPLIDRPTRSRILRSIINTSANQSGIILPDAEIPDAKRQRSGSARRKLLQPLKTTAGRQRAACPVTLTIIPEELAAGTRSSSLISLAALPLCPAQTSEQSTIPSGTVNDRDRGSNQFAGPIPLRHFSVHRTTSKDS